MSMPSSVVVEKRPQGGRARLEREDDPMGLACRQIEPRTLEDFASRLDGQRGSAGLPGKIGDLQQAAFSSVAAGAGSAHEGNVGA